MQRSALCRSRRELLILIPTSISLQSLASIQPRTSLRKGPTNVCSKGPRWWYHTDSDIWPDEKDICGLLGLPPSVRDLTAQCDLSFRRDRNIRWRSCVIASAAASSDTMNWLSSVRTLVVKKATSRPQVLPLLRFSNFASNPVRTKPKKLEFRS